MSAHRLSCSLSNADATAHHARTLGSMLHPGDVILLNGDVGAGKTHFARALIQSQLVAFEDVPSPTFTLVQTYESAVGEIWHADLYRLTDLQEIEELGLTDAFETAICLVEWPDRLGDLAPEHALTLELMTGDNADARRLTVLWHHSKWSAKLAGWQA